MLVKAVVPPSTQCLRWCVSWLNLGNESVGSRWLARPLAADSWVCGQGRGTATGSGWPRHATKSS